MSASYGVVDIDSLQLMLSLPAREGPATYTFSPSNSDVEIVMASVDAELKGYGFVPVTPVSGTIAVEHLTPDAFVVSFDMTWETADHETFSVVGRAENAGCKLVSYPPECHPYD